MRLSYKNCQKKACAIKNSKTLAVTLYILKYLSQAGIHKWAQTGSLSFFHIYYKRVFSWGHRQSNCNRIVPSKPTKFRLDHSQELSKSKYIWRLNRYKISAFPSLRSLSTTWKPILQVKNPTTEQTYEDWWNVWRVKVERFEPFTNMQSVNIHPGNTTFSQKASN